MVKNKLSSMVHSYTSFRRLLRRSVEMQNREKKRIAALNLRVANLELELQDLELWLKGNKESPERGDKLCRKYAVEDQLDRILMGVTA